MLIEKSKNPVEYLDFERSGWDTRVEVTVIMTGLLEQIARAKKK